MINWIIGGLIIGAALYIIVKTIIRLRKGENTCGCSDCSGGTCCSKGKKKKNLNMY